jgi:hypothetical protein
MKNGAVALIDALGFRGIWKRHDPKGVLATLTNMKESMEQRVKELSNQVWMECRIAFFSDTVAISMALGESTKNRDAMSAVYLGDVVSQTLHSALHSEVPLAYRGAIAIGEYDISPPFVIGRAVDEAASAYARAQGAMVWLTPRARNQVANWLKDQPRNTHLVKFDVPLKGGDAFGTYTVSPLEQARDQNEANALTKRLLESFSGSDADVSVAVKRQNTARHICACYEWRSFKLAAELSDF